MGVWPRKRPLILHIVLLSQTSCKGCVCVCIRRIEYNKKCNAQPGTIGRVVRETQHPFVSSRGSEAYWFTEAENTTELVNPNIDWLHF